MRKSDNLESLLKRYGRSVYITSEKLNSEIFNALVQPLRYKNKMYVAGTNTEIGLAEENYYLYIGPGNKDLRKMGASVMLHTADGKSYEVQKSEKIYSGESVFYIWAVIKEKVGTEI